MPRFHRFWRDRWGRTGWLAEELVRTDGWLATAREYGHVQFAERLEIYRQFVREIRSDLMRGGWVPDLALCPMCRRLIDFEIVSRGAVCPYCLLAVAERTSHHDRARAAATAARSEPIGGASVEVRSPGEAAHPRVAFEPGGLVRVPRQD